MTPLQAGQIKGNWATLVLPLNSDDSIDYSLLSHEVDLLISIGVDGIYSNGSAGEFYNITEGEFDSCTQILADKCNAASINFQIGISHMSPLTSLERLKRAKYFCPSALQVILPDWFVPTMEESRTFLKKMEQEADGIGLVLYNPPHAKKQLTRKEIQALKAVVQGLVGIKVTGGGRAWFQEMKKNVDNLSVFIPGHQLATGIKNGAHGAYSNMACLNPMAAQKWYNLALIDLDKALELAYRINTFIEQYIMPLIVQEKYSNMAVDKFLVHLGGWLELNPRLRWPYRSIDRKMVESIKPHGKKLIPEFFVG